MYLFTDTTQPPQDRILPKEALMINGMYLEELVPGYRTLTVLGREAMTAEIETQSNGKRDGSTLLFRRYPERVIRIKYQLVADSAEAFREAYNALAAALHVENAQLIFNDEPDKYFTGTPGKLESVEPGRNAVISEIEFVCPDPYKYSLMEYEVEQDEDGKLNCIYNGTFPGKPLFTAQFLKEAYTDGESVVHDGSCGYIVLAHDNGTALTFGNPEETDGQTVAMTETLVNDKLISSDAWTADVAARWKLNDSAAVTYGTKKGTVGMLPSVSTVKDASSQYFTGAKSYGSDTYWHGPSITCEIPPDSQGASGAINFIFQCVLKCCYGNADTTQIGGVALYIHNSSGIKIAGVRIWKTAAGSKGKVVFVAEGVVKDTVEIDFQNGNKYFGSWGNNSIRITKAGSKIKIFAGGITLTRDCPSIESTAATHITFQFLCRGSSKPLTWNGVYSWKFQKMGVDTWVDNPNKFTAGDLLEIDCEDGTVWQNSIPALALGDIRNDWEGFSLVPGENIISAVCSDWCLDPPTITMQYREVFL